MKLTEIFNAKAVAINYDEAASNAVPYLGSGLFPSKKKAGLDLKWLRGHKGLPVSLMPTALDAKSTFRDRIGIKINETEMPFFRESMLVKERDEQEIMRVQDSNDPYAIQVLESIFNDAQTLIDGANVVPERMIMQLLCPIGGNIGIEINANGVDYTYNYDPDGSWKEKHYMKIETAADKWSANETCDPIDDLEAALDAQEAESGTRPAIAVMSPATFKLLRKSEKIKQGVVAQVATATVNMTSRRVKDFIKEELNLDILVYSKKFKDESGAEKSFYKDNGVMLVPNRALGSTWYGTTPEERTLSQKPGASVSIVNTGVAVSVSIVDDPVSTKTTVSEIVLPSFEGMDDCYFMEVA
mgnify:CR=1 FL=1